ncbi:GntR family transcriptional regulator [Loigolactobacillus coryniformis subsp. coryniformis]|uniref:GntR family transcriptional regulator n=1 Tax=Loigolactobacillus coryniformis subsp. coryniformis KCTC 3167 = DSM 20001 TaxID=913848 RepID=A0A0R1EWW1_9LACO|nr:GntR family transcriptional regulator [Loigolactobacillus coryniformis]ATO54379.1 GntR family transcriptional regulator [Loigolactobacillus coryniformis subsp. coryniformis KCTC 3167 = DSM 20001]KRK13977.1 GntR family transcriptional regulator [Loigolactobacillus coryniformis subsp. coryniformis KCTC 3167 = DSM 20001]OEH91042.1 GntR family transcriptional regulator [Loigolactobacillus coryniformis subsp. coryniformis]RRG00812.1 MAG: GntR family transcriptional regulator [Lactobacillus sp.]
MKKKETHIYIHAYELLRDQILSGKIDASVKLTETKLADDLKISRTPVRSAIAKLEDEGLIKNKHIYVPTETDIRHIFQVRSILEGYAARYCSEFISDDTLQKLSKCVDTGFHGNNEEKLQANYLFHQLIVEETHNPEIVKIINRMQSIIHLLRTTVTLHKRPQLVEEHQEILLAIQSNDGCLAEKLIHKHLEKDLEFSVNRLPRLE